ncbi:MAG TPA: hypothetical protein VGL44_12440 [Gaiellales bacterium]
MTTTKFRSRTRDEQRQRTQPMSDYSGLPGGRDDEQAGLRLRKRAAASTTLSAALVLIVLGVIALVALLGLVLMIAIGRSL